MLTGGYSPKKTAYLEFWMGKQRMSALARPNLVDFVQFLLSQTHGTSGMSIMNVCDVEPYEFNQITGAFRRSGRFPKRPVIRVPISLVWMLTRLAGLILPKKKQWLHSGYQKLTQDLVFDNTSSDL